MAVHTKHPVGAPPTAPIRATTGHLLLRGWCIFVIASALAGPAWTQAVGIVGTVVVAAAAGVVSTGLWLALRPPVQWRRLPWFATAYILWAAASLLWTAHPMTTAVTLALLVLTAALGMFVGAVLTWRELVRAIASALKWVLALSILFELWAALIWRGPVLAGFVRPADAAGATGGSGASGTSGTDAVWSSGSLFSGGALHGVFGDASALAFVAILGMVVFAIRFASRAPRRALVVGWFALSAFLFVRAGSVTGWVGIAAVVVVLATVLAMRTTRHPGERTRYYIVYAVVAAGGLIALWAAREPVFALLGRESDLVGREGVWSLVAAKAVERPLLGWGFATPWLPTDPTFDGWIVEDGRTVLQAHSMWLDVFFQLGVIGVVLIALTLLAYVWRSWFFAIDRPRWDLTADRPYSPVTLLPTLVGAVLLAQGLAESEPLLGWGWMFIVMLAFKIKQAPLLGRGASEQRLVGEQGEPERMPG